MNSSNVNNGDVIVVGDGILGRAIALELSDSAARIIQVGHLGEGAASSAAGAMLGAIGEATAEKISEVDEAETQLRVDALRMYPEWLRRISNQSSQNIVQGNGTFIISNATSASDRANLSHMRKTAGLHNLPVQDVSPLDIPGYRPSPRCIADSAIFLPEEGWVDSSSLLSALDEALRKRDHIVRYPIGITRLIWRNDVVEGVELVNGTRLFAQKIIVAAGAATASILADSGLHSVLPPVMCGKGSSLTLSTETPAPHVIRTPNREFACGTHVVPRANGGLYLGATNRISDTPASKGGPTAGEIHNLLHSGIHEINTSLRTVPINGIFFGYRPLTTDRYPLFGRTRLQGLYVATGTYRNGILMAPAIARAIGELLTNSEVEDTIFAPVRRSDLLTRIKNTTDTAISQGSRDLVSFLQEPHGALPYNRSEELTHFIEALLRMSLSDDSRGQEDKARARALLSERPIAESIPRLFYQLQGRNN